VTDDRLRRLPYGRPGTKYGLRRTDLTLFDWTLLAALVALSLLVAIALIPFTLSPFL
jgi:hypothetical protein